MSKGLEALKRLMTDYYEMCQDLGSNEDQYQRWNLTSERAIIAKELNEYEQYKVIEEELGIDLITLFKALKSTDGLWVNCEHVPQLQSLLAACKEPGQKIFKYPHSPQIGYFEDRETKEQHFGFKIYNYFISIKDYGKAWAFAKNELTKENAENENEKVGIACLSKDQQNEIKELFKNGSSLQELAEKYKVSKTTILEVIKTLFKEE